MKFLKKMLVVVVFVLCLVIPSYAAHTWFISEITEIAFPKAVMESNEPIVIWFYAGGTQGKLAEDIDKYAQKKSRVKILKMDKSLNTLTASKYKVRRHNTFIFFADGEAVGKTTSISTIDDLDEFINHCFEDYAKTLKEEKNNEWKPTRLTDKSDKGDKSDKDDRE